MTLMSTHKTQIDLGTAEQFAQQHFSMPEVELEQIADGETAQAFYFETAEGPRVLKISSKGDYGFRKDKLAYERFHSDAIPIPKVFEIGQMQEGLHFSVSERMPGKTLDKLSADEINTLMPKIIESLEEIHKIEPIGAGYGKWDLNGQGRNSSWHQRLERELKPDDEETIGASFYDGRLSAALRSEVGKMFELIPEERKLVHSDYGFNNTMSDGTNITGIFDWENSEYGDPLFDIAWLDFWHDYQGYAKAFKEFYASDGQEFLHYDERIVCYKLLIGIGSLGFFAHSRQEEKYENTKGIIGRIES